MADPAPLVIVDAANVVGSVPDGWWRDRAGATARLRDGLAALVDPHGAGITGVGRPHALVLVVEGKAREVASVPGVRVVAASGSGDDAVVALVADADPARERVVVTADRGLAARVRGLGARVIGPSTVRAARTGR